MALSLHSKSRAHPAHGLGLKSATLWEFPGPNGETRRLVIARDLSNVLRLLDGSSPLELVILKYINTGHISERINPTATQESLNTCVRYGLVIDSNRANETDMLSPLKSRSHYLRVRFTLVPSLVVNTLSKLLHPFFTSSGFLCAVLFILTAQGLFLWRCPWHNLLGLDGLNQLSISLVFILTIGAGLLHELGHAAALRFFGETPGVIGAGVYLYWPVLYTDVSRVWRLPQHERAVVDLAGVYLQLLCHAFIMMYYVVAHSPGLLVAMMMIDLSVAGSLNPFIRMDGYWLLVDLSGVPNPHQLALVIFKKACHAGVHRFMGRDADSLKLSRSDWAILMYGMFCVGFIGWLSIVLFQQTWSHIIPDYLRLWSRVIRLSGLRAWKSNGVWIVFDLGWDTLILFGVVLFSRRILSYTIQAASSISGYVRRSL